MLLNSMAGGVVAMTQEMNETASTSLVRRFTDQLDGTTDLEKATISAQEKFDAEEERALDQRLRSYFEDTDDSLALDFSAAEIARRSLQAVCKEMEREVKPSRLGKIGALFGKQRQSTKLQANEALEGFIARDFKDLKLFVENQETQWKSTHGKIYKNFQRICRNADAHKRVFDIFPQQNMYASVFCGSISLIVQASVNHEEIAETLSDAVTEIAIESSYCVQLIDVIRTPAMREQLSKVYSLVFRFFRDAIDWYLRSSRSKFFGSFNDSIKTSFDDATKAIKDTISHMFNRSLPIAMAARVEMIHRGVDFSKAELLRQRQNQWAQNGSSSDPGEFMQAFLKAMAMYQMQATEEAAPKMISTPPRKNIIEDVPEGNDQVQREVLNNEARHLENFIVGDEGHELFNSGQFWMSDANTSSVLQNWMTGEDVPRTLWLSGPATTHTMSSAQAAAMNAVFAAWKVSVPIISHFCQRPRHSDNTLSCEQAGVIGLVYSLITQLLQFNVEDDNLEMGLENINNLDGSINSFLGALEVLYRLLVCTPVLKYCVIHDLNALEWGGNQEWCHDFLDTIFRAQTKARQSFKILLTTSGSSRVLAERIPAEGRYFAGRDAYRMPITVQEYGNPGKIE